MQSKVGFSGNLMTRKLTQPKVSFSWTLRNRMRFDFIKNWVAYHVLSKALTKATGIQVMKGKLRARKISGDGSSLDYGVIAHGLVTDAFVEFMVDELQADTTEWGDFKYHDSGVGVTGANVADTDIETTDNEARGVGTQIEGATAEIYKSVGTITYSGALAITEHGLFSQAAGTTLMDRHTFGAINVVNTDSIEFTYELTCTSGG